ncbi:hypothetical protein ES705_31036 [subsurface metagenome]
MQQAQNEFRKIEARYFALKEHLEFIGIDADSLYVDRIKSSIFLKSPISGYVTKSEGKIGQFCTTELPVFLVISNTNASLNLKVFDPDAWKVEKDQEIEFNTIHNPARKYRAVVSASAKSVAENGAVNFYARIIDLDKNLIPGMYVKAKIIVDADSSYALNNQAIVERNGLYFIFIKADSAGFIPLKVDIGRISDEYIEVISVSEDLMNAEVVISGASYLLSELSVDD